MPAILRSRARKGKHYFPLRREVLPCYAISMAKTKGRPKTAVEHGSCVSLWLTEDEKETLKKAATLGRSPVGPWVARIALDSARRVLGTP